MQELRVESWTELHERLFEASWREQLGRHRSERRVPRPRARRRGPRDEPAAGWARPAALEGPLTAGASASYARRGDVPYDSTWNWLALAPAPRPADAAARLDVLALRRAALRDDGARPVRGRRRRLDDRLRARARAAARTRCATSSTTRARTSSRRRCSTARRRRRSELDDLAEDDDFVALPRAAVARRPDRQPVRALLADVVADRVARRLGRATTGTSSGGSSSRPS